MGVVGRPRLACEIGALERECPGCCTSPHDALEHIVHQVGIALVNHAQALIACLLRMRLSEQAALSIHDALHQPGLDPIAIVGKDRIGAGHLPEGYRPCAKCHREVGRMTFSVKPESGDVVLRVARSNGLQDTHRHHVLGFCQPCSQRHRPLIFAVIVFRLPGLPASRCRIDVDGGVGHHGGRGKAFFERGRVNKGLKTRAGLTPGLSYMIELVTTKIETTDQGSGRTVLRVDGDEGAFDLGDLNNFP